MFLKFSVPELVEAFDLRSEPRAAVVMLKLTGSVRDGRDLTGSDCILIIGPK